MSGVSNSIGISKTGIDSLWSKPAQIALVLGLSLMCSTLFAPNAYANGSSLAHYDLGADIGHIQPATYRRDSSRRYSSRRYSSRGFSKRRFNRSSRSFNRRGYSNRRYRNSSRYNNARRYRSSNRYYHSSYRNSRNYRRNYRRSY